MFIIAGKNISKNIGEENIEEEVQQAETEAEEIRKPENVVSCFRSIRSNSNSDMVLFRWQM